MIRSESFVMGMYNVSSVNSDQEFDDQLYRVVLWLGLLPDRVSSRFIKCDALVDLLSKPHKCAKIC